MLKVWRVCLAKLYLLIGFFIAQGVFLCSYREDYFNVGSRADSCDADGLFPTVSLVLGAAYGGKPSPL